MRSQDKKTNNHGVRLIDICENDNLVTVNGRCKNDSVGWMTFRNVSDIDYVLSSLAGYILVI